MKENILFLIAAISLAAYLGWLGAAAWQLAERRIAAEIKAAAVQK